MAGGMETEQTYCLNRATWEKEEERYNKLVSSIHNITANIIKVLSNYLIKLRYEIHCCGDLSKRGKFPEYTTGNIKLD